MISSLVTALCFVFMASSLVAIALYVKKALSSVKKLEEEIRPLISKVSAISDQGKEISVQFTEISSNLSTASKYFAESAQIIRDEVAELKVIVSEGAVVARDKVEMVGKTIERTNMQVIATTDFIEAKVVEPAREIAAVMAGIRRGLEVLFAPSPKDADKAYTDDDMFIG
jgi:hypothetical protein